MRPERVDALFRGLVNTLGGMLCASLQFMDGKSMSAPRWTFGHDGVRNAHHERFAAPRNGTAASAAAAATNLANVRRAVLPREVLCTENLTPFTSLLPCEMRDGVAGLLEPTVVHAASYNAITLHLRHVCKQGFDDLCRGIGVDIAAGARSSDDAFMLELVQTVTMVTDVRPHRHGAVGTGEELLHALYARAAASSPRTAVHPCPMSSHSRVYVLGDRAGLEALVPAPADGVQPLSDVLNVARGRPLSHCAVYDLHRQPLEAGLRRAGDGDAVASSLLRTAAGGDGVPPPPPARVWMERFVTGSEQQQRGALHTLIHNSDQRHAHELTYFEQWPWQVLPLFHTLAMSGTPRSQWAPQHVRLSPAERRAAPSVVEIALRVPPNSTTRIDIEFLKVHQHWAAFPPDAHRGHDIGAASLFVRASAPSRKIGDAQFTYSLEWSRLHYGNLLTGDARASRVVRVCSTSASVLLPFPDFSMPYNVATITLSAVAMLFLNTVNVLMRRLGKVRDGDEFHAKRPLQALLGVVAGVVAKVRARLRRRAPAPQ